TSVSRYSRTSSAVSGSSSTWSTLIGCSRRAVVPELGAVWVASSFSMQSWVSCMVMISVGGGKVREENFEAVNVSIGLAETVELLSMIWNKERVEAAVERARLGLAEVNAEGCFVRANQTFLSMLGMREEDLIGKPWSVSVHPDDYGIVRDAYKAARIVGSDYKEIRAIRADSTIIYQALTVAGVRDENGEFRGYTCVRHDISGYKRDKEALLLAVESAPSGLLIDDRGI